MTHLCCWLGKFCERSEQTPELLSYHCHCSLIWIFNIFAGNREVRWHPRPHLIWRNWRNCAIKKSKVKKKPHQFIKREYRSRFYGSIFSPPSIPQFLSIVCPKCPILSELSNFVRLSNFVQNVQLLLAVKPGTKSRFGTCTTAIARSKKISKKC